ncbi:MAG: hypothetical protein WD557_11930 [Dehalococcoidia bacterium]
MARRNITIAVDEGLARWTRVRAAECDKSVSQLVAEMLERERASGDRGSGAKYHQAMRDFFAIKPKRLRRRGERLPTRDEMHER